MDNNTDRFAGRISVGKPEHQCRSAPPPEIWCLCSRTRSVTVQTSYATPYLLLIQQKLYYWISNSSRVAELVCTVTTRSAE